MFPKDELEAPCTVNVNPYSKWNVATGLPKVAGRRTRFARPTTTTFFTTRRLRSAISRRSI